MIGVSVDILRRRRREFGMAVGERRYTDINIGEIHYHKENKTNGGKQIEFSAESNQFGKKK